MNPYQQPTANPYAPPQAPTGYAANAAYGPGGHSPSAYVEGKLLVAANGSTLPPMCMKCGAPPAVWRAQNYTYTPPWAFFFLGWIGLLIFSKRSSFQVPLCAEHQAAWKKWNLLAGLSWLPGVVLWVLGGIVADSDAGIGAVFFLLGTLVFFVGLITALVIRGRRIVFPAKIDKTHSWLRGVHANVLQAVSSPQVPQGYGVPQQPYPGAQPYPG
jgi:hypothetical protein